MPSLFSRFKSRDGPTKVKSKKNGGAPGPVSDLAPKPKWDDAFTRKTVEPEEISELVKLCTEELKARALDIPFLLLPFRPTSDPSAVRTFVRHFFDQTPPLAGEPLSQELRMTEPMVISGVIKWCWSRLQGGVVGWDAYELFKIGEQDSNGAYDSFTTFIPLSVDNAARSSIIFCFFDLMAAIAAHGKANGFGGRKLSRMASWWAFEAKDTGNGFEGGYKNWLKAADATSHLFFAYLRSLAPRPGMSSFAMLPMSLQKLLQETEYPPQRPVLLQSTTNKVIMIVDAVSPTPFALLRRGSHFEYRDEDRALREFSDYEDPLLALTDECRRVLKAISAANQTQAVSSSKHSTSLRDASWSRFEDIGFGSLLEEDTEEDDSQPATLAERRARAVRSTQAAGTDSMARPTTPSWADFLSSGFVDDGPSSRTNMLLPPDKVLPPIDTNIRQRSSQSHRPRLETERTLEPGELASISHFELDDAFWWVWMTSLSPEETPERKSAFGRCAVIETRIRTGRWLVMEEIVKGAAAEPEPGAYLVEKKGFFSWTRRGKGVSRSKSTNKHLDKGAHGPNLLAPGNTMGTSKTSLAPDQQAKIQAAAQRLQARQKLELRDQNSETLAKRGRIESTATEKTNSVFTLQPVIASEASPALKWASKYDKEAIREAYLSNSNAGRGNLASVSSPAVHVNGLTDTTNGADASGASAPTAIRSENVPITVVSVPPPAGPEVHSDLSEKPFEAAESPSSPHPATLAEVSGEGSPAVPLKDERTRSIGSTPVGPVSDADAAAEDSKKAGKKLQKDPKDEKTALPTSATSGTFRKLFRKNRLSKLPETAAADVKTMLAADSAADARPEPVSKHTPPSTAPSSEPVVPAPAPAPEPVSISKPEPAPVETPVVTSALPHSTEPLMELPRTPTVSDQIYHSTDYSASGIDGADGSSESENAVREFSKFDQGPLVEQPAFVPEDSDTEVDEAIPPPIARQRSPVSPTAAPVSPIDEAGSPAPPVVQDRWAQIRKNAADRAARRQAEEPTMRYSKTTDGDDDTSGEETIESRVARIKARVAELTGNIESVSAPGNRTAPVRRDI